MSKFDEQAALFMKEFGKARLMVLSTSLNDKVTSRMMSVIQIDDCFYFQTDQSFRKYDQMKENPNVGLCIDNIQIEGTCEDLGQPLQNEAFCNVYQECYQNSYKLYSSLESERLFSVKPTYVERWHYIDGVPYMEMMDFQRKEYRMVRY